MKISLPVLLSSAVLAAIVACATAWAQAQTPSPLGPLFKTEIRDCSSAPPLNFALLPEGHRCEIQAQDGLSLKSAIPCGCEIFGASFGNAQGNDLRCVAGGPAQITITRNGQTQTVFAAAGEVAFFRADNEGRISCRAARWRDVSEMLRNFDWPQAQPVMK